MKSAKTIGVVLSVVLLVGLLGIAVRHASRTSRGGGVAEKTFTATAQPGAVGEVAPPGAVAKMQPYTGLRLVEPVRLTVQTGEALSNQVAAARIVLARFSKTGFRAVWAVDALPADPKDLAEWTQACLAAFPEPPILALDVGLEGSALRPDSEAMRSFLVPVLAKTHSVVLNYTGLDNYVCVSNQVQAIAAVKTLAVLVHALSPKTFRWLFLDDDPTSADRIPAWAKELGGSADGYYLYFGHGLSAMSDEGLNRTAGPLLASGKPVIRGGFAYSAPRVRPALAQDIRDQYAERMSRYEGWLTTAHYAGYSRLLGKSIPGDVSKNLDYLSE